MPTTPLQLLPRDALIAQAAAVFSLPAAQIQRPCGRSRSQVKARELAALCLRRFTLMSFPEIAQALGYGGHPAAMHAVRQAARDRDLSAAAAVIAGRIGNPTGSLA